MNIQEAYRAVRDGLAKAGVGNAGFDADALIRLATGRGRFELERLSEDEWRALQALAARRAAREPLQYILGRWPFLDLELEVGPGVLIPRGETEEVCLAAAEKLAGCAAPRVLDLCAGSGALALGLQSLCPAADVTAVEFSPEAFAWLERNTRAFAAGRTRAPRLLLADALAGHEAFAEGSLDLIVSNPPYVSEAEYARLAPEVRCEPRVALVAGEDGLLFYREIAAHYHRALRPGGWLVFEIGAGQGAAVGGLLREKGYVGVEIRPDLAGLDRIALAKRPLGTSFH